LSVIHAFEETVEVPSFFAALECTPSLFLGDGSSGLAGPSGR
jgi:hypothetical protein